MVSRPVSHVRIVLEALKLKGSLPDDSTQRVPPTAPDAAGATTASAVPGKLKTAAASGSKATADYAAELAAVKALASALAAHPQALRIESARADITNQLTAAATHALKKEWPAAMADLTAARAKCVAAKQLADDWQVFAVLRTSVVAPRMAVAGSFDEDEAALQAAIDSADLQVSTSPPNFAGATATLNAAVNTLPALFKDVVDTIKDMLTKLKSMAQSTQTFLAKEIAEGTTLVAKAEAAFAAKAWSRVMMCWRAAFEAMGAAERHGQRRVAYDTQRGATLADIAKVKALPALKGSGPALDALLVKADALADHKQMKIEEGAAVLKDASKRCQALLGAAPTVTSHSTERTAADNELAVLAKHGAAAQIAEPLAAIRKQLSDAAASATQARANAVDPTALWQTALTQVQRARADIAATKNLADGLGPAAAAQAAAGGANAATMRKSLTALQADLATAGKAAHADLAQLQLEACAKQAALADKALTKSDTQAAAGFLLAASKALAQARTTQAQHGQFTSSLGAIETRLAALRKLPTAKSINAKIEAVARAVAAAKKQDQGAEGEAAMAALRLACSRRQGRCRPTRF
jgi:hypothetical protein